MTPMFCRARTGASRGCIFASPVNLVVFHNGSLQVLDGRKTFAWLLLMISFILSRLAFQTKSIRSGDFLCVVP